MTEAIEQNPYRCSDGGCVLNVPGAPTGQHTNGGCKCLHHDSPETRRRVHQGIRWLASRAAPDTYWRTLLSRTVDALDDLTALRPKTPRHKVDYMEILLRGAIVTARAALAHPTDRAAMTEGTQQAPPQ